MKYYLLLSFFLGSIIGTAQTDPAITSWIQNTTIFGSYYTAATGVTPIDMTVLANVQKVEYSEDWVYVTTEGIPAYPTGIFTGDGNTNLAGAQGAIYKIPLNPTENTGTPVATSLNNIGVFINGVSLFDWQDGVKWNPSTNDICGGPPGLNARCPMGLVANWNRDAVPAESEGFDCAKGHPAGTNYHHHQNPTAFKYDDPTASIFSDICDLYDSEALYTLDISQHSPLIGFAFDGFPIYGAYGYTNTDGTGEITRMKSSQQLTTNTTRVDGPDMSETYFNGYFREDYVYVENTSPDYLDEHNGRFCVTPEYPDGMYCYFATINEDNSSAFPYTVGPTFYGEVTASNVNTVTENTTVYTSGTTSTVGNLDNLELTIFPNPANEIVSLRLTGLNRENLLVELFDFAGKKVRTSSINAGATNLFIDTQTLYEGNYLVKISGIKGSITKKFIIIR